MADQPTNKIQGETFKKPLQLNGALIHGDVITIPRAPYHLEQHEFQTLKSANGGISDWSKRSFQIALGAGFTIVAKIGYILSNINNPCVKREDLNILKWWEFIAPLLAVVAGIVLSIVSKSRPTEKDKLISILKNHFDKN